MHSGLSCGMKWPVARLRHQGRSLCDRPVPDVKEAIRDACPGAVYTIRPFRTAYSTISAVL